MLTHVDVHHLKALNACSVQMALFQKTFGKVPVAVTEANARVAREAGLDVAFLARLLPQGLQAEYDRQVAPLWAEYTRQAAPLWAEYDRQVDAVLVALLTRVEA